MAASVAQAEPASLDDYMKQASHPPDVAIHYGPAPSQVAELFLPKGKGPHPVVVLLHGGCFLQQFEGFAQTSGLAADLAGRGYAVWNVEYRKLGEPGAGYPGTFQDVATAVDRLRTEAPKYGLDLHRVVAVGHSAGGHLALWAASRGKLPAGSPLYARRPAQDRRGHQPRRDRRPEGPGQGLRLALRRRHPRAPAGHRQPAPTPMPTPRPPSSCRLARRWSWCMASSIR